MVEPKPYLVPKLLNKGTKMDITIYDIKCQLRMLAMLKINDDFEPGDDQYGYFLLIQNVIKQLEIYEKSLENK